MSSPAFVADGAELIVLLDERFERLEVRLD
jgi:hypothetical protein